MIYVRAFMSLITHNLGTKVISVLIAFVLWSIVMGSRTVVGEKEVPLKVITSDDMVIVSRYPTIARFRISGPKTLLRSILNRNDAPIEIDLRNSKPGIVSYHLDTDSIQQYSGVKALSVSPSNIDFTLEEVATKSVPLLLETQGTPEEGFRLASGSFSPPQIELKGAKSQIDKIRQVSTLPVDLAKMKQSEVKAYKLDLQSYPSVQFVGEMPKLSLVFEAITANFKIRNVPVRLLSVPGGVQALLIDKAVTVFVRAAEDDLNDLDQSKVFAEIDLQVIGIKEKGTYSLPVTVKLPPDISLVKTHPEKVQVKLF